MNSHFEKVNLDLSEDEKTWLRKVYEETEREGTFDPRVLRIRLRDRLSTSFRPSSIDEKIYDSRGRDRELPGLTLVGTWLVNSDSRRVKLAEAVIQTIRQLILESPKQRDFSAHEVAKALDEGLEASVADVAKVFVDIRDLGPFWSGGRAWAPEDEETEGYKTISTDSEGVITQYLRFDGLDSYIPYFIDRWSQGGLLKSGWRRGGSAFAPGRSQSYVDEERIEELREVESEEFDLSRLVRLCQELNACHQSQCYHAVAMVVRTIINHVPPIFGCQRFSEVANNYGEAGRSFKKAMQRLNTTSRAIADAHLHIQARSSETLPNYIQVNFAAELDVLLGEIVRRLR